MSVVVEGLVHVYRGGRKALDGLSFAAPKGALFGVLGPNGGGKTTLFKVLSTALVPTGGDASLAGESVAKQPERVRRRIGVVFQNPSLDKKLTVWENVTFQGRLYGLSGADLASKAEALLHRMGLGDRRDDFCGKLSGGLQRRVEIAKGLLHSPEVLLLDEPTTGLDPNARRDVWTLLAELKERGVTVLVTTHLMEEAERCDRLLLVHEGRKVAEGTPAALKAEIGGDVVRIASPDPRGLARGMKEKLSMAAEVVDGVVRLERSDGPRFVAQIAATFPDLATSITVGRPTLEDVFVRRTGHRFWGEGKS